MKKLLTLALMAIITLGATAQVRTSRTFTHVKKTTWYLRAGMNFSTPSSIKTDEDNSAYTTYDASGKVGFDMDFGFQKKIGTSNAYWGMELGVGTRGVDVKEFYDGEENENFDGSCTALGITYSPITFGYKYSLTDNIKLDGHLGAFLSYDLGSIGSYSYELDNSFDAGMQIGVGVWFSHVNLDFTYQAGFCNAFNGGELYNVKDSCKIGKFMIRLGYAF